MKFILCFLLVTAGLFILTGVSLGDILIRPFDEKRRIKRQIRRITGKKRDSIERILHAARQMLIASDMEKQIKRYKTMSILFSACGIFIGFLLNNLLVSIVLGVGFSAIPLVIIYFRTGEYIKILNEKLENSLNTVTNNYLHSGELISSVKKSIYLIPAPIDVVFKEFLVDVSLDDDVVKAINKMSTKIDNRYFDDWCHVLVQCQHDNSLRIALSGIVTRLSEMRILKMQADTIMKKHINEYVLITVVVLSAIPIAAIMMNEWWVMLTTSTLGKITLATVFAGVLACSVWVAKLLTGKTGESL